MPDTTMYTQYPGDDIRERVDDEPWILPSTLPGMDTPPAGDIPPGGVEPEVGDSCDSLNMDPMPANDPMVEAAKWGGIYQEGKFPWCVAKSGTPSTPTPEPDLPEPTTPGKTIDQFCRDQGYVKESDANRKMLIAGGVAFTGGALIGGVIGYLAGR